MSLCFHRWSTLKRWSTKDQYHIIQRCRKCNTFIRKDLSMDGSLDIDTQEYVDNEKFNAKAMIYAPNAEQRVLLEQALERDRKRRGDVPTSQTSVESDTSQGEADTSSFNNGKSA